MTVATLSPAMKAAATRRANREAQVLAALVVMPIEAPKPSAARDLDLLAQVMGSRDMAAAALARNGGNLARTCAKEPGLAFVAEIGAAFIRSHAEGEGRTLLTSWTALKDYLLTTMGGRGREQFRVLFLDTKNRLIADEVMGEGSIAHAPAYPREVLRRALELDAANIVIAHNHPSGDPTPSQADWGMTAQIVAACRTCSIAVHDHVIVGRTGAVASLASLKGGAL